METDDDDNIEMIAKVAVDETYVHHTDKEGVAKPSSGGNTVPISSHIEGKKAGDKRTGDSSATEAYTAASVSSEKKTGVRSKEEKAKESSIKKTEKENIQEGTCSGLEESLGSMDVHE